MTTKIAALCGCVIALAGSGCGGGSDGSDGGEEGSDPLGGGGSETQGSTGGMGGDGGESVDTADEVAPVPFACDREARVVEGFNDLWEAGGQARQFYADLPDVDDTTAVAVIFSWHGVGDTAQNFRRFLLGSGAIGPSRDPELPFILITPQGLRLNPAPGLLGESPKMGLEWDIFGAASGLDNLEASLFESVLGCLNEDFLIDASRIYTVGFSGGAIVANMLHSRYPDLVAAVYAMSGAWFNDENQRNNVNTGGLISIAFDWDELDATDSGAVIVSHGGPADAYNPVEWFEIINLETCAQHARAFLPAHNRTMIDCAHTAGHQPHPQVTAHVVLDFFKAHRVGVDSTYRTDGLPASFPGSCVLAAPF